MRRAKIVGTIGPASDSPEILSKLIAAGLDVARLNFSYGSHDQHARRIQTIRAAAQALGRAVAILQDLQGPRLRIGALAAPVQVKAGETISLTIDPTVAGIPVSYPALPNDVKRGDRILIDDGLIELVVEETTAKTVRCGVITGGAINSHKGMNLPGVAVSAPTLGDKDRDDMAFGLGQGVDYIALSFVRGPDDLTSARTLMRTLQTDRATGDVPLIAKIERPEAVEQLEAILGVADGIMIARGDLAIETSPEAVPLIQKRIIRLCSQRRVPVITATQMLESMTEHPRPTRAEASDVANAVFDGTDAVMLSAETAAGQYPVESVEIMARILAAAESGQNGITGAIEEDRHLFAAQRSQSMVARSAASFPAAICAAGARAAEETGARVIVAFTESGTTARLVSKERPTVPIVTYTPHESTRRRLALYWGVLPRAMPTIPNTDELIRAIERSLRDEKMVEAGDRIVVLLGAPAGTKGSTNLMKLHTISESRS